MFATGVGSVDKLGQPKNQIRTKGSEVGQHPCAHKNVTRTRVNGAKPWGLAVAGVPDVAQRCETPLNRGVDARPPFTGNELSLDAAGISERHVEEAV